MEGLLGLEQEGLCQFHEGLDLSGTNVYREN